MVRPATMADIPRMVELGEEFFNETVYPSVTEYDPDSLAGLLAGMLESPTACVLLLEVDGEVVGGAAGMLIPLWFNLRHQSFQELFWFVAPSARGGRAPLQLFKAVEAWAKQSGAASIMVTGQATSATGVNAWYRRLGYEPNETHYIRSL